MSFGFAVEQNSGFFNNDLPVGIVKGIPRRGKPELRIKVPGVLCIRSAHKQMGNTLAFCTPNSRFHQLIENPALTKGRVDDASRNLTNLSRKSVFIRDEST